MEQSEIEDLLDRFLAGEAAESEIALLVRWLDQKAGSVGLSWRDERHRVAIEKMLRNRLQERIERDTRRRRMVRLIGRSAAAVALLASLIGLFRYPFSDNPRNLEEANQPFKEAVVEGTKTAILVLADGRSIQLGDHQQGIALDAMVLDEPLPSGTRSASKEWNTIHIPKGGSFQVMLNDGTSVEMNAGTSLSYPVDFGSEERRVELVGEAFFDVQHDSKRPFHVISNDIDIAVLGTEFNVRAYPDEPASAVTLASGKVHVVNAAESLFLNPGEQAYAGKGDKLTKRPVDVDHVLAWRSGYFSFEQQDIRAIMASIGRWYDREIIFEAGVSNRTYAGRISKSKSLEEVLALLSELGDVKFKIAERRITVMN